MDYTPRVNQESRTPLHLPGLILVVCIAIAVGFFLIWPPDLEARTLFFPGTTAVSFSAERRLLPRASDRRREIFLVVQELILGPAQIRHGRLLPRSTRISSLAIDDSTIYLDLSPDLIFGEEEVRVDVQTGLEGIEATVLYNFRWVEEVVLTIGGQEPFVPSFRLPDSVVPTSEDSTG